MNEQPAMNLAKSSFDLYELLKLESTNHSLHANEVERMT